MASDPYSQDIIDSLRSHGIDVPDPVQPLTHQQRVRLGELNHEASVLDNFHSVKEQERLERLQQDTRTIRRHISQSEEDQQALRRRLLDTAAQPEPDQPPTLLDTMRVSGDRDFRLEARVALEDTTTPAGRGLRAAGQSLAAAVPGTEALIRGTFGDERGAVLAADRALRRQERAAEIGPDTSMRGVLEGDDSLVEWAAGAISAQAPILATFIGSGFVGGLVSRGLQQGAAQALRAQAVRTGATLAGTERRVAAQLLQLNRAREAHAAARTRSTAGAVGGRTTQLRYDRQRLAMAQEVHDEARELLVRHALKRARNEQIGSAVAATSAGVPLYGAETSQFLIDPEADATIQQRAAAGIGAAFVASLASMAPTVAVLRNVDMGASAAFQIQRATQSALTRVGGAAGRQAVYEGSAEAVAEISKTAVHGLINDNIEVFSNDQIWQYMEAAVVGGMLGGGIGGATAARGSDFRELSSWMMRLRPAGPSESLVIQSRSEAERSRSARRAQPENDQARQLYDTLDDETRAQQSFEGPGGFLEEFKWDRAETTALGNLVDGMDALEAGTLLRILVDPTAAEAAATPLESGAELSSLGSAAYERLAAVVGEGNMAATLDAARDSLLAQEAFLLRMDNLAFDTKPLAPAEARQMSRRIQGRRERIKAIRVEMQSEGIESSPAFNREMAAEMLGDRFGQDRVSVAVDDEELVSAELTKEGIQRDAGDEEFIAGTQEADLVVSFPFGPDDRAAGPDAQPRSTEGKTNIGPVGRVWTRNSEAARKQAEKINQRSGMDLEAGPGPAQVVPVAEAMERAKMSSEDIIAVAREHWVEDTGRGSRFRKEQAKKAADVAKVQAEVEQVRQRLAELKAQAPSPIAQIQEERNNLIARLEVEVESADDRVAAARLEIAKAYLNQFETVISERLPDSVSGREQRRFSDREANALILYKMPLNLEGHTRGELAGSPVAINIVGATQAMYGRIDDRQASGRSKEERQRSGERERAEGGTSRAEAGLDGIARAFSEAMAAMIERGVKFPPTIRGDTIVFRRAGGEAITAGELIGQTALSKKAARMIQDTDVAGLTRNRNRLQAALKATWMIQDTDVAGLTRNRNRLQAALKEAKGKEQRAALMQRIKSFNARIEKAKGLKEQRAALMQRIKSFNARIEKAEAAQEKQIKRLLDQAKGLERAVSIVGAAPFKKRSDASLKEQAERRLAVLNKKRTSLAAKGEQAGLIKNKKKREAAFDALTVEWSDWRAEQAAWVAIRDMLDTLTPKQTDARLTRARKRLARAKVALMEERLDRAYIALGLREGAQTNSRVETMKEFIRNEINGVNEAAFRDPDQGYVIFGEKVQLDEGHDIRVKELRRELKMLKKIEEPSQEQIEYIQLLQEALPDDFSVLLGPTIFAIKQQLEALKNRKPLATLASQTELGRIEVVARYSPETLRSNPEKVYVFGDNLVKKGKGGQAIIRDEPNAFGIPTKRLPSMSAQAFFGKNITEEKAAITAAIDELIALRRQGKTIVFPRDGLGSGRARIIQKSPEVAAHLSSELKRFRSLEQTEQKQPAQPAQPAQLAQPAATPEVKKSAQAVEQQLKIPESGKGSLANPHVVPMNFEISRPELRDKYKGSDGIAKLIRNKAWLATFRRPLVGVKQGHIFSIPLFLGKYQVIGFVKTDLKSGGWSIEAESTFSSQVQHGETQMLFFRVDEAQPAQPAQSAQLAQPAATPEVKKSAPAAAKRQVVEDAIVRATTQVNTAQRENEARYASRIIKGLKLAQTTLGSVISTAEAGKRVKGKNIDLNNHDGLVFQRINRETGEITIDIWVNETITDPAERLGVIHHEMGEAIVTSLAYKIDVGDAVAIIAAYNKWRAQAERGSQGAVIKSKRSLLNMLRVRRNDPTMIEQLTQAERDNLLDFQEWFADNVGRWLETNARPRGVIEKFFASVAAKLKQLMGLNRKEGLPETTVASMLNRMWDSKAPNGHIRKFNLWQQLTKHEALSRVSKIEDIVEEIRSQYKGPIDPKRALTGSVVAATQPHSIEAFWGIRDYIVAKMSSEERRALSRVFIRPSVQRSLKATYQRSAKAGQIIPSDPLSQLAVGYMLYTAGKLDLQPNSAKPFRAMSQWLHKVAGMVQAHDQAYQVLSAIQADVFSARETTLFAEAPSGSGLNRGAYVLESAQLRQLAQWEKLFNITEQLSNGAKGVNELIETLVDRADPSVFPKHLHANLIADMSGGVFTEEFLAQFKDQSDFVLNPDKTFEIQKIIGTEPLQHSAQAVYNLLSGSKDFLRNSLLGKAALGEAYRGRLMENLGFLGLQEALFTDVLQEGPGEGFINRKDWMSGAFQTEWESIWSGLTVDEQKNFREAFYRHEKPSTPAVQAALQRTNRFMRKLHKYAQEVGLLKGSRFDGNYRPWAFDARKVDLHSSRLLEAWTHQRYRKQWFKLLKKHYPDQYAIQEDFTSDADYQSYVRAWIASIAFENGFADNHRPNPDEVRTQPIAQALNRRELAFLDDPKLAPEADRQLLAGLFDDSINTTMAKYISQMVKKVEYVRKFGAHDEKLNRLYAQARELGATDKDVELMQNMVKSATGRHGLEVATFWKKIAEPINKLYKPVRDTGGQPFKSREDAMHALKSMTGSGEVVSVEGGFEVRRSITADPRRFRQNMSWVVVYQNWRLLAMAAFTNVADLAGIAFRTGNLFLAFEAYREGVGRVIRDVKGAKRPADVKRAEMDSVERLAQELGVVAHASVSDHLGLQYGSVHMTGRAKIWNDTLFKLNGMEYLTRAIRIMAVAAGRRYLAMHAQLAKDGVEGSIELLTQLGLDPADVRLDADGELTLMPIDRINEVLEGSKFATGIGVNEAINRGEKVDAKAAEVARDDRVKRALNRMVDESVLRPASWQRPTWMNDPNWQIFSHLKGFMYTYHERVLRRIIGRGIAGSVAPLIMAAGYVAVMIAADWLREIIQHGPEGDDRKERWGVKERVADGIHRSGLLGMYTVIPDMMKTHEFGRSMLAQMGGPATSQVEQLYRALLGPGDVGMAFRRALPASQIVVDPMVSWSSWAVNPKALEPERRGLGVPLVRPEVVEALSSDG